MSGPGRLPDLLVIGAQKSGTRSLTHYLDLHPQVSMCRDELDFFARDEVWGRGVEWYRSRFPPPADGIRIVGETSPSYAMRATFPDAAERVAATLPDAHLVYLLRHPVDRMLSAYLHGLTRGAESRPMDEALLDDAFYVDASCYAAQLEAYARVLPAEAISVLLTEDLRDRRVETVHRLYATLGLTGGVDRSLLGREDNRSAGRRVPRTWARALGRLIITRGWNDRVPRWLVRMRDRQSPLMTRQVRAAEREMSPALRAELEHRLRPDVQELRRWLGPDFHGWGLLGH